MSLTKEDLRAITKIVREENEHLREDLSDQIEAVRSELLGHIDGLAVLMNSNFNSHDSRIAQNTTEIHGVKDFLKMQ